MFLSPFILTQIILRACTKLAFPQMEISLQINLSLICTAYLHLNNTYDNSYHLSSACYMPNECVRYLKCIISASKLELNITHEVTEAQRG